MAGKTCYFPESGVSGYSNNRICVIQQQIGTFVHHQRRKTFMANEVYIGVDLGGTRVRAARFTYELEMLARTEAPSLAKVGKEAVIERIFSEVQTVWPTDGSKVAGIGVTAPGPTNPKIGMIINLTNFIGWHNVPLRDLFEQKFGVKTY